MSTALHTASTTEKRDGRRRGVVVLKFGLAGAALLGIAAAATSAAWSNDAWFSATAKGATVGLEAGTGSDLSAVTWSPASGDGSGVTVPVDSSVFGDLLPGQTRTVKLNVRNTGSTPFTLNATAPTVAFVTGGDDILTTSSSDTTRALVTVSTNTATTLAANGGTTTVDLTVSVPGNWATTNQTKSEAFTVDFHGMATQS